MTEPDPPAEEQDPAPEARVIGDDAALAGMPLVAGSEQAATLDTLINETRDYIAQGKVKDNTLLPAKIAGVVPVSKGGTGGADKASARNNLSVVEQAGAVIRLRWDQPGLNWVPAVNGQETSALIRFDQGDARYVRKALLAQDLPAIDEIWTELTLLRRELVQLRRRVRDLEKPPPPEQEVS